MWYILLNISHSHRICIKLEETRPRFMLTSLQETQMKEWSLRGPPLVNELYQQMEAGFSHDNSFQMLSNWESCSGFHTWSSLNRSGHMEIPNPNPNPVILSVRVGNSYLFSHTGCAQKFKFTVLQFLSATFALLILHHYSRTLLFYSCPLCANMC